MRPKRARIPEYLEREVSGFGFQGPAPADLPYDLPTVEPARQDGGNGKRDSGDEPKEPHALLALTMLTATYPITDRRFIATGARPPPAACDRSAMKDDALCASSILIFSSRVILHFRWFFRIRNAARPFSPVANGIRGRWIGIRGVSIVSADACGSLGFIARISFAVSAIWRAGSTVVGRKVNQQALVLEIRIRILLLSRYSGNPSRLAASAVFVESLNSSIPPDP